MAEPQSCPWPSPQTKSTDRTLRLLLLLLLLRLLFLLLLLELLRLRAQGANGLLLLLFLPRRLRVRDRKQQRLRTGRHELPRLQSGRTGPLEEKRAWLAAKLLPNGGSGELRHAQAAAWYAPCSGHEGLGAKGRRQEVGIGRPPRSSLRPTLRA